jgi:uncharacterized protein (TIGR03790 family)
VLVVVNTNSPESLEVANYYRIKRSIPERNFLHLPLATDYQIRSDEWERTVLQPLQAYLDAEGLRPHIRFVVYTIGTPYRVNVVRPESTRDFPSSITTVTSAGAPSITHMGPHPYYRAAEAFRGRPHQPFLSMMLTGWEVADVKRCIDQGVASDGTRPGGTVYLFDGVGPRARVHEAYGRPEAISLLQQLGIKHEVREKHSLTTEQDVIGYWTGYTRVNVKGVGFLPGALADHMTSYGGILHKKKGQMKILDFIAAGATASYGCVEEPTNTPTRHSKAWLFDRYGRGLSAIESYHSALESLRMGVFVGEPLAAPWARPPAIKLSGLPPRSAQQGEASGVRISAKPGSKGAAIRRCDFWVDGRWFAPAVRLVAAPGTRCSLTVGDRAVTHTTSGFQTPVECAAALAALVEADAEWAKPSGVRATAEGGRLRLEARSGGVALNDQPVALAIAPPEQAEAEPALGKCVAPLVCRPEAAALAGGRASVTDVAKVHLLITGKKIQAGDTITIASKGESFTATAAEGEKLEGLMKRLIEQLEKATVFRKRSAEEIAAYKQRYRREPSSPFPMRVMYDKSRYNLELGSVQEGAAGNGQAIAITVTPVAGSDLQAKPTGRVEMAGGGVREFRASVELDLSASAGALRDVRAPFDTAALPDGPHTLRLVVEEQQPIAAQAWVEVPFLTANHGGKLSVQLKGIKVKGEGRKRRNTLVRKGRTMTMSGPIEVRARVVTPAAPGAFQRLVLQVDGREVAASEKPATTFTLDPAAVPLGVGAHTIRVTAEYDGNPGIRSDGEDLLYAPPAPPAAPAKK